MDKTALLATLSKTLSPEIVELVAAHIPGDAVFADNQNQNQGGLEDFAKLKPEVLRSLAIPRPGSEAMDNQNQNQGKLEDLVKLKPSVLQEVRVALSGSEDAMDNQNQNQGSVPTVEAAKPSILR